MDEEARAAQEGAKAIQEVAKAAVAYQPTVDQVGSFFAKLMSPVEQGASLFADYIKGRRLELAITQEARIKALMKERGITTIRYMPLSTAVPLIDAATLEEDDALAQMFANLIVSHIDGNADAYIPKQFTETLRQMSPFEAVVLKAIGNAPHRAMNESGMIYTAPLPNEYWDAELPDDFEKPAAERKLVLALSSLQRAGCIDGGVTWGGYRTVDHVRLTEFGRAFLDAVSPTKA